MIQSITKERWSLAQAAERSFHVLDFQSGYDLYEKSYGHVFRYLGLEKDQKLKTIVEVGPADFPALAYCENVRGIVVEPMESNHLDMICSALSIFRISKPLEEISLAAIKEMDADEAWCFNCLQHIIDPELFIEKCKQIAPVIRFFEPIDFGTSDCHPHTYSIDDFVRWFGHAERYKGGSDEGFHTADCAYGTWRGE